MPSSTTQTADRTWRRGFATTVTGVGMAAVILCVGLLLANGIRAKGGELLVQQVFQSERSLHASENKLLQSKTLELLREYAFAFADAAIRFETVPKLDTRLLYSVVTAMPEDLVVKRIVFEGYDLMLDCLAATESTQEQFLTRLEADSQTEASLEQTQTETEEGWRFRVRCATREQPGELRFSPDTDATEELPTGIE